MSRASAVLKFLPKNSMLLQNAAKEWHMLGHWFSNLWAAKLGICYSNVYGKILFALLNILSNVNILGYKNKLFNFREI